MSKKQLAFSEADHLTLASPTPQDSATFTSFVQRNMMPVFFILVLLLTWPLQVVDALGSHGLVSFRIPIVYQILFVAYMPSVAAILVTGITEGQSGIKTLLQKLLIWKVGLGWYIFAILGYALFCSGAVVFAKLLSPEIIPFLGQEAGNSSGIEMLMMLPLLFLVVTFINGEELAWRGFALPRLQENHSALSSSLLLGIVWVIFHLPLFLTNTGGPLDSLGILSRSIQLIGASVIFTWLYNHTRGSVLLAYLLHGSVNTWTRIFPISESSPLVGWFLTAIICLFAFFLVAVFGPKHLRLAGGRVVRTGE